MDFQIKIEKFKPKNEFYGLFTEQIPKLVALEKRPMSISEIMIKRIEADMTGSVGVKNYWHNNFFDSGDAFLYHPSGDIKVVPTFKYFLKVNENTKLKEGFLPLGRSVNESIDKYNSIEGVVFTKGELEKFTKKDVVLMYSSKEDIINNPVWNAVVSDKDLLKDYVDMAHKNIRSIFKQDNLMDIVIGEPGKFAGAKNLSLKNIVLFGNSNLRADYDLNDQDGVGRFMGVDLDKSYF
ncbi:MAG: hypothetical protein ACMXX9_03520 [Candidatus Woesearchaeota archaeon]